MAKKNKYTSRFKAILLGCLLMATTLGVLFSVSQLDKIREFFSKASGEPANLIVDTRAILGPMPRPWRNLAQGGESHAWRIQPIQEKVNALHPQFIRIDHIYDFYDIVKGSPGNLSFDFTKLDLLLDDIKAAGATPYISLSYMPPAIAHGDILAKPDNWADWQLTIQKTVEHISGTRNTPNVYYEVWNEPDLFGKWKYYGDKNYLTLYDTAVRGAQNASVRQSFKIGGPATTALYKNWFDALLTHAQQNNVRLDFFSWHRYDNDIDQYRTDMDQAQNWLAAHPQFDGLLELHITEWGHDSEINQGYDNNYAAAHTVAGAIEMVGVVDKAFLFEIQDGKDPAGQAHWGRWGLMTHNDFGATTKPRYAALKMLDSVANQRLQLLGKGSWVKALASVDENGHYKIVISNFDPAGRHAETVPLTLTNLPAGTYTVNSKSLTGQQHTEAITAIDGKIMTSVAMPPNSVSLVEISQ